MFTETTNQPYYEKHRQAWYLNLLVAAVALIPIGQLMRSGFLGFNSTKPDSFIPLALTCILFLILIPSYLKLQINADSICYQYFPFHWKYQQIRWVDVKHAEVVKTNPLLDFGGWGIRFVRGGKAYIINGRYVLKLTLHNDKKIYIGTTQPKELTNYLQNHPHSV